MDGGRNDEEHQVLSGDYVLLTYPNRPPNKLAGMYRGPMVTTVVDHPDLIIVKDLSTNRESLVHASRLIPFTHPKDMSTEKIESLVAADWDEFHVEKIIGHTGTRKNTGSSEFVGVDTSQRTTRCWIGL